jgi:hypothetical protein
MPADLTDELAGLLVEYIDEQTENAKLLAEARRMVFGKRLRPLLTLNLKLGSMLWIWQHYTERVDRWAGMEEHLINTLTGELRLLPRGREHAKRRAELKDQIAEAQWRRNAARHVLYSEYPDRQLELSDFLRACWEESGVEEVEIDARLETFNEIIVCRYYHEAFWNNSLMEIAATVATE